MDIYTAFLLTLRTQRVFTTSFNQTNAFPMDLFYPRMLLQASWRSRDWNTNHPISKWHTLPAELNELLSSHLGNTSGQIFNLSGPSTPNPVLSQYTIFGFWIMPPKIFGGLIPAEEVIEVNLKVLYLNEYKDKDPGLYVFCFCKKRIWRNRFRQFWGLFECHVSSLYMFLLILNSVEFKNLTYKVINNQALSYVKDLVVCSTIHPSIPVHPSCYGATCGVHPGQVCHFIAPYFTCTPINHSFLSSLAHTWCFFLFSCAFLCLFSFQLIRWPSWTWFC